MSANFFLFYISGPQGMLRLLLLAMLSDAGDEGVIVVRCGDTERADPADAAFNIARFVARIEYLFVQGHCVNCGYTKVMLEFLKHPIIYTVKGQ